MFANFIFILREKKGIFILWWSGCDDAARSYEEGEIKIILFVYTVEMYEHETETITATHTIFLTERTYFTCCLANEIFLDFEMVKHMFSESFKQ